LRFERAVLAFIVLLSLIVCAYKTEETPAGGVQDVAGRLTNSATRFTYLNVYKSTMLERRLISQMELKKQSTRTTSTDRPTTINTSKYFCRCLATP